MIWLEYGLKCWIGWRLGDGSWFLYEAAVSVREWEKG